MTRGERIAVIIGVVAAFPVAYFGFIIGGMAGGLATGGLLAIPGALIGAALVLLAGGVVALMVFRTVRYLYHCVRRNR